MVSARLGLEGFRVYALSWRLGVGEVYITMVCREFRLWVQVWCNLGVGIIGKSSYPVMVLA